AELPRPVGLPAANHRGPVTEVRDAGKEEVAGAGEEVAGHGEDEEVAGGGFVALRALQEEPEDTAEKEIDERAVCGDPARFDVGLERDGADGDALGAAEPGGDAVAQAFVENVPEDADKRRDGNQGEAVVFGGGRGGGHGVHL